MKTYSFPEDQAGLVRLALRTQIKHSFENRRIPLFREHLRKEIAALRSLRRARRILVEQY